VALLLDKGKALGRSFLYRIVCVMTNCWQFFSTCLLGPCCSSGSNLGAGKTQPPTVRVRCQHLPPVLAGRHRPHRYALVAPATEWLSRWRSSAGGSNAARRIRDRHDQQAFGDGVWRSWGAAPSAYHSGRRYRQMRRHGISTGQVT
jgi:hypothetical protein